MPRGDLTTLSLATHATAVASGPPGVVPRVLAPDPDGPLCLMREGEHGEPPLLDGIAPRVRWRGDDLPTHGLASHTRVALESIWSAATSDLLTDPAADDFASAARSLLDWAAVDGRGTLAVVGPDALNLEREETLLGACRRHRLRPRTIRWPVALARWFLAQAPAIPDLEFVQRDGDFLGKMLCIRAERARVQAVFVRLLAFPSGAWLEAPPGSGDDDTELALRVVPARDREQDQLVECSVDAPSAEAHVRTILDGHSTARDSVAVPPIFSTSQIEEIASMLHSYLDSNDSPLIGVVTSGHSSSSIARSMRNAVAEDASDAIPPVVASGHVADLVLGGQLLLGDEHGGLIPYFESAPSIEILGSPQAPRRFKVRQTRERYWVDLLHGLETRFRDRSWLPAGKELNHAPEGLNLNAIPGTDATFDVVFDRRTDDEVRRLEVRIPPMPEHRSGSETSRPVRVTVSYRLGTGRPIVRIEWKETAVKLPSITLDWPSMTSTGERRADITTQTWADLMETRP